ncbi:MAG: hypothetical protein FD160_3886 [Caulobacteraceae bacterium]|nr:MAG: hypothetical protein FD160_3886 [Caulobacteraceae bacterium]
MIRKYVENARTFLLVLGIVTPLGFAATSMATAQERSPQAELENARKELGDIFRGSRRGAMMPSGPWYTELFARAAVASEEPPACMMQVLTVVGTHMLHPDAQRRLELGTRFRLLSRNDGASPTLPDADLASRCENEPTNLRWFTGDAYAAQESVAAAWAASGALLAIAAGKSTYEGKDLSRFADRPQTRDSQFALSIEQFAKDAGEDVSSVSIERTNGDTFVATVTFGGGGMAGCRLEVRAAFTQRYERDTRSFDTQLSSIEIGAVEFYVV